MQKAISSGREVIVHIPMASESSNINPGANAITQNLSEREIYERVRGYFSEITFAKGANQHMGSLISQNKQLLRASFRYLAENDYFFIDSRTTPNTVAREVASEMGISFEERNLFLDSPTSSDEVLRERLMDLQKVLETTGRALVITHCHDRGRLERLRIFIIEARKMGFEIVPASKYVRQDINI
jgi:hypothetical protein